MGYDFLQKRGVWATVLKILRMVVRHIRMLPHNVRERIRGPKLAAALRGSVAGKDVWVIIANIDWYVPLFQRPHQIATELSGRPGNAVIFVSNQFRHDRFCFSERIDDTLYLLSVNGTRRLPDVLRDAKSVTAMLTWPMHASLLDRFAYDTLIYEFVDDMEYLYHHAYLAWNREELVRTHERLVRTADLTTVSADRLYDEVKPITHRLLLCENACDYEFWASRRDCPPAAILSGVTQPFECVIGYYGSLAEWFDYDLVNEVARCCPQWMFLLVGLNSDNSCQRLEKRPNIVLIDAQPYVELPSFAAAFTVQTIPFLVNRVTQAVSPVKLFEYMAIGKPILSADLPECRKYDGVAIYTGVDEFIAQVQALLEKKDDPHYRALLEREARANTWAARVDSILAALHNGQNEQEARACSG